MDPLRFLMAGLEPTRGAWNYYAADFVVKEAGERDIKILGILGGAPSWANGKYTWDYPPTDIPAWLTYVTNVCGRYRGEVAAWEVWNE